MAESVWARGMKEVLRQMNEQEGPTCRAVPRTVVNDFLAVIGVPARDTCRVEIGVDEIRVHSYGRLDDGERYLGPDGVATRVDVFPIRADGGSVEPGDVPVLLQKGCVVSTSRYGESHIELLRRLNGEDA